MDIITPESLPKKAFTDPQEAWNYISHIYRRNTGFIREKLIDLTQGHVPKGRVRAYYPEVQVTSRSYGKTDSESSGTSVFGSQLFPSDNDQDQTTESIGVTLNQMVYDRSRFTTLRSQRALSRATGLSGSAPPPRRR